jgi:hypothetical protein
MVKRSMLFFVFAALLAASVIAALADDQPPGSITGTWQAATGDPIGNGLVLAFDETSGPPPSSENYWRVPDLVGLIDAQGRFSIQIKPGTYYLGVAKRQKGNGVGPLAPGDYYSFSRGDQGRPRTYAVKAGEDTSIGALVGATRFNGIPQKGATAIEGTVVDQGGKPLDGVSVFAFVNREMKGRPLFVSPKTDKDGRFRLGLGQGGTYYLRIRDIYGGGPLQIGQLTGFYGEGKPLPLKIETGSTTRGITIRGNKFAGRGAANSN